MLFFKSLKRKLKNIIEGDCEVRLRSSSQQPPSIYVKWNWFQPRIEPVIKDLPKNCLEVPADDNIAFVQPRPDERGDRSGHSSGARGHRRTRGSELSGSECKIHQLKLRPADAMSFFFYFGPKFEHLRTL